MADTSLTHERELTEPVDLCAPDGRSLNPAAKGWSRTTLHRANLRGRWGRTKRWDYWGIFSDEIVVSVTFANIDYLAFANVEWIEIKTGRKGGHLGPTLPGKRIDLPDEPSTTPLHFRSKHLSIDIVEDDDVTRLVASWADRGGVPARLEVEVGARRQDSLNVVIPWDDKRFQFTSKHQGRPAVGHLDVGDAHWELGGADPTGDAIEAWATLDVGRGRWPYSTRWNWGGAAGRATDGTTVGLQFGAKWTEGTGYTENGVILDGTISKIGEELTWEYDWDHAMEPWRVHGTCGLDVTLVPVYDRHANLNAGVFANGVHQVFGRWSGVVPDGRGGTLTVEHLLGFAEESFSRW